MNVTIPERNRIVEENLPLVRFFVRRYRGLLQHQYDDAMQAGVIGFMRAIERYDPNHPSGTSLSGYASRWIRTFISNAVKFERGLQDLVDDQAPWDDLVVDDEERMLLALECKNLERYIAKLPERQQVILNARLGGETSSNRIAKTLSVTGQRVRQLEAAAYDEIRRSERRRRGPLADLLRLGA